MPPGDGFNPRTYIRYDLRVLSWLPLRLWFQSTYLYKVRPKFRPFEHGYKQFQSTYLYKVRPSDWLPSPGGIAFQSTYLYKVRRFIDFSKTAEVFFNPRTYIRYDQKYPPNKPYRFVSIHVPI